MWWNMYAAIEPVAKDAQRGFHLGNCADYAPHWPHDTGHLEQMAALSYAGARGLCHSNTDLLEVAGGTLPRRASRTARQQFHWLVPFSVSGVGCDWNHSNHSASSSVSTSQRATLPVCR